MLFHAASPSPLHRTAWSWCSSSPKPQLSPPCLSLSETSTISWWAARTAPSTCHVVMEGAFTSGRWSPGRPSPNTARKLRRLVGPTQHRVSNKYSPLTSQCKANPTLDLPLFEVSLLPSHPVFLFRLSVVFVKVVQHKQGTHAGETNHSFPVLLSMFLRVREFVYSRSSRGELKLQFIPQCSHLRGFSHKDQKKYQCAARSRQRYMSCSMPRDRREGVAASFLHSSITSVIGRIIFHLIYNGMILSLQLIMHKHHSR